MPLRDARVGIRIANNNGRLGARCCLTSRYQQAIGSRHTARIPVVTRSPDFVSHLVIVI
jgi:hypothetical protein